MKKKTISLFILLVFGSILICSSCKKDKNPELDEQDVFVNNNKEELNKNLKLVNRPISIRSYTKESKMVIPYSFIQVAQIDPITGLSASHVVLKDNYAYVTYNKQGDEHGGGVQIIDLSDKENPQIITSEIYTNADVNVVCAGINGSPENRNLYLGLSSKANGAVLRKINTNGGQFNGEYTDLNINDFTEDISASVNGLVRAGDYLYLSCGKSVGGTYRINATDMTYIDSDLYPNAKYIASNGTSSTSRLTTLCASENSTLHIFEAGQSPANSTSLDIGQIIHQNVDDPYKGKSTIYIAEDNDIAWVSMGKNGLHAYNISDGGNSNPIYNTPDYMLTSGNTNAVSIDNNLIYLANGADGLGFATIPNTRETTVWMQGWWDMEEVNESANYVTTDGEWIFIAKGHGGLIILRKVNAFSNYSMRFDGTVDNPQYIEAHDQLVSTYPFSIAQWVKIDEITNADKTDGVFFGLTNQNEQYYQYGQMVAAPNGKISLRANNNMHPINDLNGPPQYDNSQWHFVVSVFESESSLKLYINGELANTPFNRTCPLYNALDTWSMGRWGDAQAASYFRGSIDECSFWTKALTEEEINDIMWSPLSGLEEGLQNYWNFEEGSGNILHDIIGNADGIIYNSEWSNDTPY